MGEKMFSEEFVGMTAMTAGGYLLGMVDDVVFDTETGELKYLLIKLRGTPKKGQKVDAGGRAIVAFDGLKISGKNVTIL